MFYKLLDKNVVKLSYNSYKPNNQVWCGKGRTKIEFLLQQKWYRKKTFIVAKLHLRKSTAWYKLFLASEM